VRRVLTGILLCLALAGPAHAAWSCAAGEQLDTNISGLLEMEVDDEGRKQPPYFVINWSKQPGYAAEQQMSWLGIPVDAELLWKPDRYAFGIAGRKTDRRGVLIFRSPKGQQHNLSAHGRVKSLRSNFGLTWVELEDGQTRTRIWSGEQWTVEHRDRRGRELGTAKLLLPAASVAQSLYSRLRAKLLPMAGAPDRHCQRVERADELDQIVI
jgi:hypothetical protein